MNLSYKPDIETRRILDDLKSRFGEKTYTGVLTRVIQQYSRLLDDQNRLQERCREFEALFARIRKREDDRNALEEAKKRLALDEDEVHRLIGEFGTG